MDESALEPLSLEALASQWQTRLRLADWDVHVSWCRRSEIAGLLGECSWVTSKRSAQIMLADPCDREEHDESAEQTLIHELLHLHFALIDTDANSMHSVIIEQAVHAIATVLAMTPTAP